MDSTGLRVILRRLKATPVILRHPTPQVIRLLALCGVRHLVGLTVESAPEQVNCSPQKHEGAMETALRLFLGVTSWSIPISILIRAAPKG